MKKYDIYLTLHKQMFIIINKCLIRGDKVERKGKINFSINKKESLLITTGNGRTTWNVQASAC